MTGYDSRGLKSSPRKLAGQTCRAREGVLNVNPHSPLFWELGRLLANLVRKVNFKRTSVLLEHRGRRSAVAPAERCRVKQVIGFTAYRFGDAIVHQHDYDFIAVLIECFGRIFSRTSTIPWEKFLPNTFVRFVACMNESGRS